MCSIEFGFSQNLVLNGNFELINICAEYKEQCAPVGWRATGEKLFAYSKGRDNSYIKLLLYNKAKKNQRKFAQSELLCPLEKGEQYEISVKVKANLFGVDSFCIGFSEDFLFDEHLDFQAIYPNRTCIDVSKVLRKEKWITIKTTYLAKGNERFICLGNLLDDEATKYKVLDKKEFKKLKKTYAPQGTILYGIDDVSVKSLSGISCSDMDARKKSIVSNNHRHKGEWFPYTAVKDEPSVQIEVPDPDLYRSKKILKAEALVFPTELILNDLNYENDAFRLRTTHIVDLDPLIHFMKEDSSIRVKITGHTSSVGKADYNQVLSLKRAEEVRNYLVRKGIPIHRIDAEGRGESEPMHTELDEASQKLNRRVVVSIIQ